MKRRFITLTLLAGLVVGSTVVGTPAAGAAPINDLLVDFGPQGLWVRLNHHNNISWQKLDDQSPVAVGTPCLQDGVLASFEGRGFLQKEDANDEWEVLRPDIVPFAIAAGDVDNNTHCDFGALVRYGPGEDDRLLIGLNRGAEGYWIRP